MTTSFKLNLLLSAAALGLTLNATAHAAPLAFGTTIGADAPITSQAYNDNRNSDPGHELGPVLRIKAHFDDAQIVTGDQNIDPFFGERTSAEQNLVDYYSWPRAGVYTSGGVWMPHPEDPTNDYNSAIRIDPTPSVACDFSVTLRHGQPLPRRFPLVEAYSINVSDDDRSTPEKPNQIVHKLRMDFGGGYLECSLADAQPKHAWTAGDLYGALGDRFSMSLPDASTDAPAAPVASAPAAPTSNAQAAPTVANDAPIKSVAGASAAREAAIQAAGHAANVAQ